MLSRGINVSGNIALIRLGAIFRGSKVLADYVLLSMINPKFSFSKILLGRIS